MSSRRGFIQHSSLATFSTLLFSSAGAGSNAQDFPGIVVNEEEGEAYQMRDGTAIVKIKIAKLQGAESLSFLSESFRPGDELPVHKHLNEDEFIFIHKGAGLFTLGDRQYRVGEGAVALVPRGIWHGLQNNGKDNIEMRFGYTPSGFENFFREVGTPVGQAMVKRTAEERRAIARKWGMVYRD